MKAASISELKQELTTLSPKKLVELCLRLARYKKENKELLTYLLFEAHNEQSFVETIKKEIDEQFTELPKATPYLNKKSLRKILRSVSKYSKHTGSKESAVEMLLHFCIKLKNSGISIHKNKALSNLYNQQLKKLNELVEMVHEDLAFDYKKQLEQLV
ncbi:MAG: hypothetical protein ABJA79_02830 [Parafilimonas sp.]